MSKERLEEMLEHYRHHENDEHLIDMIAVLRNRFLDYEVVNRKLNYDISSELVNGPEHVLMYLAEYIDIIEQQNKRYREAIDKVVGDDNLSPYQKRILKKSIRR